MRPHVAKNYFESYEIYDHMQNIRAISQNLTKVLKFNNFEMTKFCCTLNYKNLCNSKLKNRNSNFAKKVVFDE